MVGGGELLLDVGKLSLLSLEIVEAVAKKESKSKTPPRDKPPVEVRADILNKSVNTLLGLSFG